MMKVLGSDYLKEASILGFMEPTVKKTKKVHKDLQIRSDARQSMNHPFSLGNSVYIRAELNYPRPK